MMHPWRPYSELSDSERVARATAFAGRLANRRSCRSFSDRPVPRATIEAAIAAAITAPSGANRRPWHFAVIGSPGAKTALRVAVEEEEYRFHGTRGELQTAVRALGGRAEKPFFEIAPWLIVAFGQTRPEAGGLLPNPCVVESVGLACGLLLAALHEAGLATLIHSPGSARFLKRLCRRPEYEKPVMLIVVGHAAEDAVISGAALKPKPLEQFTSWL